MTMGERIKLARQEAGLSQRQLAGEAMTRNMLSALEHDGANPSVSTLRYLSEKLSKPISYFLGEDVRFTAEEEVLRRGREAYKQGEWKQCITLLEESEQTEGLFLQALALMEMGTAALEEGKTPYGKKLLEKARETAEKTPYFSVLKRQWILLMAKVDRSALSELQGEDEALLIRASWTMEEGNPELAQKFLEAVQEKSAQWFLLRGKAAYAQKDYEIAAQYLRRAEVEYPTQTRKMLEICYREMGEYRLAYEYATMK